MKNDTARGAGDALSTARIDTPLGPLDATVDAHGQLVHLDFEGRGDSARRPALGSGDGVAPKAAAALAGVAAQLAEYFAGRRRHFSLPLAPRGTAFQRRVWDALLRIPYGATLSYRELAARVGNPAACRAVARANETNPLAIVIPCHRVIGADGSLTGYGGGLDKKRRLLDLEATSTPE